MDLICISAEARKSDGIIPVETLPSGTKDTEKVECSEGRLQTCYPFKKREESQRPPGGHRGCYSHRFGVHRSEEQSTSTLISKDGTSPQQSHMARAPQSQRNVCRGMAHPIGRTWNQSLKNLMIFALLGF